METDRCAGLVLRVEAGKHHAACMMSKLGMHGLRCPDGRECREQEGQSRTRSEKEGIACVRMSARTLAMVKGCLLHGMVTALPRLAVELAMMHRHPFFALRT